MIDPDEPNTWPTDLRDLVVRLDSETDDVEAVSDLSLSDHAEQAVRQILTGQYLVAFHATRLLPHEADDIRSAGLRVFSRELFDNRIDAAHAARAIDAAQHSQLRAAHMFAVGEDKRRGKRSGVALTLCRSSFDHGAWRLLAHWGGEGLYFSSGATEFQPLLRTLGRPAIVRVVVPVQPSWKDQPCWPTLDRTLLGAWRRTRDGADLFHPSAIPGQNVLSIWQPGDPEYDAIPDLPKS
jgi:hypothetical protein